MWAVSHLRDQDSPGEKKRGGEGQHPGSVRKTLGGVGFSSDKKKGGAAGAETWTGCLISLLPDERKKSSPMSAGGKCQDLRHRGRRNRTRGGCCKGYCDLPTNRGKNKRRRSDSAVNREMVRVCRGKGNSACCSSATHVVQRAMRKEKKEE